MQRIHHIDSVLAAYPRDCHPARVEPLAGAGGFSGALIWRLAAGCGDLCLRRFSQETQDPERQEWIAQVARHVASHGFALLPQIILTSQGTATHREDGSLWQLTTWLPGMANYWCNPRPEKLQAAMEALARFHCAAENFACGASAPDRMAVSPGIAERLAFAEHLLAGGVDQLWASLGEPQGAMPDLVEPATSLLRLITPRLPELTRQLTVASTIPVLLQPCLRDIWHDHVLFEGDRVSGIIDLEAMRTESVAADVARLLGSLCGNDLSAWSLGKMTYERRRPLAEGELQLLAAFDHSTTLLAGASWIKWVFVERRSFGDPKAVERRMNHILARLADGNRLILTGRW
jgi:Ser/Thr protein kinase RdoA (MazF antagonist)